MLIDNESNRNLWIIICKNASAHQTSESGLRVSLGENVCNFIGLYIHYLI